MLHVTKYNLDSHRFLISVVHASHLIAHHLFHSLGTELETFRYWTSYLFSFLLKVQSYIRQWAELLCNRYFSAPLWKYIADSLQNISCCLDLDAVDVTLAGYMITEEDSRVRYMWFQFLFSWSSKAKWMRLENKLRIQIIGIL